MEGRTIAALRSESSLRGGVADEAIQSERTSLALDCFCYARNGDPCYSETELL